jgi:hypothetical protein
VVPYPERKELNDGVFLRGDADALDRLYREYAVRYLVVDKGAKGAQNIPRFRVVGTRAVRLTLVRVFSNGSIDVYAVPEPRAPAPA